MAQQCIALLTLALPATGTLVAARFVTPLVVQTGTDGYAIGVCRTAAVSGEVVGVDVSGTVLVEAGAAVAKGATLKADSVGRAITWVTSGARLAIALSAAAAAGDLIECLLLDNAA